MSELAVRGDGTREGYVIATLEYMARAIDLTQTQLQDATDRYEAVGSWVGGGAGLLTDAVIYPQGSIALGTAVRPLTGQEFDVDLVVRLPQVSQALPPASVKRIVGDRLIEHGTYGRICEEKKRCWRLSYAGEVHLDITPSIPNPRCTRGGNWFRIAALRIGRKATQVDFENGLSIGRVCGR